MRLFIAIDLPKEVKDYMYDLQKKLNSNFAKVKWVSKKHFHLTLQFLGEVDEDKIPQIVERLERIKSRPLKVKLSKIGFFPSEEDIRVVWLGIEPEAEIDKLANEVDGELLDMFSEEHRFKCHLTLGRVKAIKKQEEFLKKLNSVEIEPKEFEFSWLKLYKSVKVGSTHEYEYVKEF